mgnify:CR=1 FL=1
MSLIERLRDGAARKASGHSALWDALMTEAADRIEELEKANAQLNHDIGEYVDKTAELEARHDKFLKEFWKTNAENERLTAEGGILRNALKFYADGSKYHHRNGNMMGSTGPADLLPCQISSDAGQVARAALKVSDSLAAVNGDKE